MAFILDAAMGTAISELLRVVIAVAQQTAEFKSNLESLKNTLETVKSISNDIFKLHRVLNRPIGESYQFIDQLKRAVNLVEKCTTISFLKKYTYSRKLVELNNSIERFFNIGVQGSEAVNTLRNGVGIQENGEGIQV